MKRLTCNKDVNQILSILADHNWEIKHTKKHIKVLSPQTDHILIISKTPSDYRVVEKLKHQIWNMHDEYKNQMLTQQALELVEYDLNLFRSMRQAPETANYNKNAYNTGTLLGNSGFDFKQ